MSILESIEHALLKGRDMVSEEEFSALLIHNDIPINLAYEVYRSQSILRDALVLISELTEEVEDLRDRVDDLEFKDDQDKCYHPMFIKDRLGGSCER